MLAVGLELDVPFARIAAALGEFQGAERRFELPLRWVEGANGRSSAAFRFDDVPAGSYLLKLFRAGSGDATPSLKLTVPATGSVEAKF